MSAEQEHIENIKAQLNIIQNKIDRLEKFSSIAMKKLNISDDEITMQRDDLESLRVVVSNHSEAIKNIVGTMNNISTMVHNHIDINNNNNEQNIENDKKDDDSLKEVIESTK